MAEHVANLQRLRRGKVSERIPAIVPIVEALLYLLAQSAPEAAATPAPDPEPAPAPEPEAVLTRDIPVEAAPALVAEVLAELESTPLLAAPIATVSAVGPAPPVFAEDAPLRPNTAGRMAALRESEKECRKRLRRRTGEAAAEIVQRVRRIGENSSADVLGMNAPTPSASVPDGYAHTRRTVSFVRTAKNAAPVDAEGKPVNADKTPVVVNLYM